MSSGRRDARRRSDRTSSRATRPRGCCRCTGREPFGPARHGDPRGRGLRRRGRLRASCAAAKHDDRVRRAHTSCAEARFRSAGSSSGRARSSRNRSATPRPSGDSDLSQCASRCAVTECRLRLRTRRAMEGPRMRVRSCRRRLVETHCHHDSRRCAGDDACREREHRQEEAAGSRHEVRERRAERREGRRLRLFVRVRS